MKDNLRKVWKRRKEQVRRRPNGYKFFLRECIRELQVRHPDGSVVLPMVSRMCAKTWLGLDPQVKSRFQEAADYHAHHGSQSHWDVRKKAKVGEVSAGSSSAAGMTPSEPEHQHPDLDQNQNQQPLPVKKAKKQLKKPKKAKAVKGGPKRPLSSFVYFCLEERPKVQASNPTLKMGEVSQVLSKIWSGLDTGVKSKYEQVSQVDRERYHLELATFRKMTLMDASKIPKNDGGGMAGDMKYEDCHLEQILLADNENEKQNVFQNEMKLANNPGATH